jgi:zinc transport system substrate-binding protein
MKKLVLSLLLIGSILNAKNNTVVSILPEQTFAQAIGGDKVNITLMVKPGNSPHTYEPKPSQMKAIAKADIYFSIGVEFEETWLDRFQNQNHDMKIVDISKGVKKIHMVEHSHHKEHSDDKKHAHEHHEEKDPHIWTSPKNVKIIVQNIYNSFVKVDPKNKEYYKSNLDKFLLYVDNLDKDIKKILNQPNKRFMVFHPEWGYFAKEYNLIQIPIEVEGKNPKPRELKHLIEEAKEEKIDAIFTSPVFSDAIAKQIANELKIPVIKISSLDKNWGENLMTFAKTIAHTKE